MIELSAERIADEAHAKIVARGEDRFPERAVVDSRTVSPGDLFAGLAGERANGGEFAAEALAAGAWGVIVEPWYAEELAASAAANGGGWVLASHAPLRSLQRLARAWRRELGCRVVGITGSTGKTSTKDICQALLPARTHSSPENYNTEVGLPLAILRAPPEAEVLVLEMAMRGVGQIAELCEIAEPDVAAITNVGPVHLELLGTIEAIAEAKAEILAGVAEGGIAVVPADAEALEPHLHERLTTVTFGPGGDVFALQSRVEDGQTFAGIGTPHGAASFHLPFAEAHNLRNALCAVAIGVALGMPIEAMAGRAGEVRISTLRGELVELPGGATVINDCYNANPISIKAALDSLAARPAAGKRIAVLGEMAELGPESEAYHREAGAHARQLGIDLVIGVGEAARAYAPDALDPDPDSAARRLGELLGPGDLALVKGSRSAGLEAVARVLREHRPAASEEPS